MIFVGFGYLMTFLRKYGFSAVGFTFLVAAVCIQWHILVGGAVENLFAAEWKPIKLTIETFVTSDFAAGSVLIAFGVLLGKITPSQLVLVALLQVVFYSVNENLGIMLGAVDVGGSLVIHAFGAYFGLAAAWVLGRAHEAGEEVMTPRHGSHVKDKASVYHSDLFAMIGTLFLWMFWPSFNSVLAGGEAAQRTIINTLLSLTGSCIAAFWASYIFRGENRFCMEDIQNATLAGGVAAGTSANMVIFPFGAILIGTLAGTISVLGYTQLSPVLDKSAGIADTCGVHNLHGLPGVMGGIAGAVAAFLSTEARYTGPGMSSGVEQLAAVFPARFHEGVQVRTAEEQAVLQLLFLLITLTLAVTSGLFSGWLARATLKAPEAPFKDSEHWEVPLEEVPMYFDAVARSSGHASFA
eukprot:jgi/Mesvir1/20551/Mv21740-RA.2